MRHIPITLALARQEGFQVSCNDCIKWVLCGIPRTVDLLEWHEDIAGCKRRHIRRANENRKLHRAAGEKSRYSAIMSSRLFRLCRLSACQVVMSDRRTILANPNEESTFPR